MAGMEVCWHVAGMEVCKGGWHEAGVRQLRPAQALPLAWAGGCTQAGARTHTRTHTTPGSLLP